MKERIQYIDLAKGFCIFLVVWFHVFSQYNLTLPFSSLLKSFRMPLYFILSGFFFKTYSGFFSFLKRKTNKLLIPFAFFYIFTSLLLTAVLNTLGINIRCVGRLNDPITFIFGLYYESFSNPPIWFLFCLFNINIIYYVIIIIRNKLKLGSIFVIIVSLALGIIGATMHLYNFSLPMFYDSSLTALPFFVFGNIINKKTDILRSWKYDRYIPIFVIIIIAITYYLTIETNIDYRCSEFSMKEVLVIYPTGIMGSLCVLGISKMIVKLPYISYCGRYSIIILVTHNLMIAMLKPVLAKLHLATLQESCLSLFCIMASYIIIIPLFIKFLPHVTAQKDLIKID